MDFRQSGHILNTTASQSQVSGSSPQKSVNGENGIFQTGVQPRKRMLLLVCIMTLTIISTLILSITFLYRTALNEEKIRLAETAKSQAELINAVAAFDKQYSQDYPEGAKAATLSQIKEAHSHYKGFGDTGEFTLAERVNDSIVFLLNHRHYDLDNLRPVPWDTDIAEPMRLALSGKSGIIIDLDYRGATVVAAYEPVTELNLGIVAKIDLAEIQAPFIKAGIMATVLAAALTVLGAYIFIRITNPIITELSNTVTSLQATLRELKTLRGILPICSYCKKIRDDDGYWNQVEEYVSKHSDADFSHGICPSCVDDHFPELADKIHRQSKKNQLQER